MDPVLTIQRYLHLVEEALSVVTEETDKNSLLESKKTLLRYKTIVSHNAIDKESFVELLEADDLIHLNNDDHCLVPLRQVLKSGPIQLQAESRDEDSVIPKGKHQVYLFNDALLCAKKDKVLQREGRNVHRRDKKYREVCTLPMHTVKLGESPEGENVIKLVEAATKDLERKFTIFCSSAPEKQEWLEAFQKSILWSNQRKIIGVPFDELMASDREQANLVPSLVEQCTSALVSSGALRKEGLIRVSAPTSEMLELTNRLNEGQDIDMRKMDPHLIVSLLKKFFRDMPECIFTSELYDKLIKLSGM